MYDFLMSVVWMVSLVSVGWFVVFQLNAWRYRRFAEAIMIQEAEEREMLERYYDEIAEAKSIASGEGLPF